MPLQAFIFSECTFLLVITCGSEATQVNVFQLLTFMLMSMKLNSSINFLFWFSESEECQKLRPIFYAVRCNWHIYVTCTVASDTTLFPLQYTWPGWATGSSLPGHRAEGRHQTAIGILQSY